MEVKEQHLRKLETELKKNEEPTGMTDELLREHIRKLQKAWRGAELLRTAVA